MLHWYFYGVPFTFVSKHFNLIFKDSVHHHFTEHNIKKFSPPIWNSGRLDIHISSLQRFRAVKMQPGVEKGGVFSCNCSAFLLGAETSGVQLRLVWHINTQPVQIVHVVGVGGDFIWKLEFHFINSFRKNYLVNMQHENSIKFKVFYIRWNCKD